MSWKGIFLRAGIDISDNTFTFASNKDIVTRLTSSVTSGTIRGITNTVTLSATGLTIVEALKSEISTEYRTGAWANAVYGKIDYGTTGSANGMAAAIAAEMIPPDGPLSRGALYALDVVFGCGSSATWASAGPVAFIHLENWGTKSNFSTNAFLFHLAGETSATGDLYYGSTLRIRIGTLTRYLVMSTAEDSLTIAGGIVIGATTTPITLNGAFTTGISIEADGTTGIVITSAFSGTTMISLAGTAADGILISGACSDNAIEITGSCTDSAFQTSTGTFATGILLGGTITTGVSIGTCTTGITLTGTVTTGIDFTGATLAPDPSRTNSAIAIGDRLGAKTITLEAAVDHLDPIQMNLLVDGVNPTAGSTINGMYQLITGDPDTAMASLRLKCTDFNVVVARNIRDAYCYQGEVDFITNAVTVGGETAVLGLVMNCASAVTGKVRGIILSMTGAGLPSTTDSIGIEIRNATAMGDLGEGIRMYGGQIQVGIVMGEPDGDNQGPASAFWFPTAAGDDAGPTRPGAKSGDGDGSIQIQVGGSAKYLQYWDDAS